MTMLGKGRGFALGALAVATASATAASARVWTQATARDVARLDELAGGESPPGEPVFMPNDLAGLPPLVARYFELVLPPGVARVRHATIRHTGEFRAKVSASASPFTSVQHVTTDPPGFVWDARIQMMPLVPTRVRDSYIAGEGAMHAAVAGLVPVVNQRGTPAMARGALVRYLAEAVWYPTALLPRRGLAWTAIDDSSARVTLTDGTTTVWLDVNFGRDGRIERVSTVRDRDVNGVGVPTRWTAIHSHYERVSGMMIPTRGEVTWHLPDGPLTYWRGRVVDVRYAR